MLYASFIGRFNFYSFSTYSIKQKATPGQRMVCRTKTPGAKNRVRVVSGAPGAAVTWHTWSAQSALQLSLSWNYCSWCFCLMLDCSCSIVSFLIAISSLKSSFLRSNYFILPIQKRELTSLARVMAVSVATLLSLSECGCKTKSKHQERKMRSECFLMHQVLL